MKTKWIWTLGITLGFFALFVMLVFLGSLLTYHRYGMLGYGWHMPVMHGGGIMFLAGLILPSLLILIVLGTIWLVKTLSATR